MTISRKYLVSSEQPLIRLLRRVRRGLLDFSLPAPALLFRPLLSIYLFFRSIHHFVVRVFVCEPFFKAYCKTYGRGLHTDIFLHWVQGKGSIIVGDHVKIDGRCSFSFAARFSDDPTLEIGDNTIISANCGFTVGKRITIGSNCMLASEVNLFDSPGHPTSPEKRLAGLPPSEDMVRPITIGNNVWIGRRSMIFPGVTIGDNSIVGAGSIVTKSVSPNTLVAGNPARVIKSLLDSPLDNNGTKDTLSSATAAK